MKVTIPFLEQVIDTECGKLNVLVVESPDLFRSLVEDFYNQSQGGDGRIVVSEKGKICQIQKKVELITQWIPFDVNTKMVLNGINSALEKEALSARHYEAGMKLLAEVESYIDSLSFDLPCEIVYNKLNLGSLIKMSGLEIQTEGFSLPHKLYHYMEIVRELAGDKLFVLVNLRSYISETDMNQLAETVLAHGFHVLLIEPFVRGSFKLENKIIIDADLCEI